MNSDSGRAALAPAGREKGVDAGEEDPKGLCVHTFRELMRGGASVFESMWVRHDRHGGGGLTEQEFGSFWHEWCQSVGRPPDPHEAHAVFRELDAESSGYLRWKDVAYPGTAASHSLSHWLRRKGRGFLGDPAKSPVASLPEVDWAPFPRDDAGGIRFGPKAALAVWNVGSGVAHHLFFAKRYEAPPGSILRSCLYAYPNMLSLLAKRSDRKEDSTFFGVALETPHAYVIFLRGTCLVAEVLADMKSINRKVADFPGAVHVGFHGVYVRGPNLQQQLKEVLQQFAAEDPGKPIVLAGHSLGGALASFAAVDALRWIPEAAHRLVLLTFGCPRCGNRAWATGFDVAMQGAGVTVWRVANKYDLVTKMGPKPWFRHCGVQLEFALKLAPMLGKHWIRNHVEAYPEWLQIQSVGNPSGCLDPTNVPADDEVLCSVQQALYFKH